MLIYAPQPDAEFAPVIGGLSDQQFSLLESRLRLLTPAIRYLKELDEGVCPAAPQYTLKLHREDRGRAIPIVHEVMDCIRPRLVSEDCDIAALVRQFTRAWQADDRSATELMQTYLCQEIQSFLGQLLRRAKIEWAVDVWLDGITAQDVNMVCPFELEIRGYIWIGTTQTREPFEVSLQASKCGPALERFSARFGDRLRLSSAAVIQCDVSEIYRINDSAYSVRVGSTVHRRDGQGVEWAFEFVKL